ncbi:MAG: hypothetical protein RIT27_1139 [Pseudomonadota bacterium]|jgi:hypothetical protein
MQFITKLFTQTRLIWGIISFGIFLRSYHYISNRSLWLDEAFIANSIVNNSFLELFKQPLEYGHVVPPLFLLMAKIPTVLFGNSDLALRLFPFLCSIASLFLFYKVAKTYLSQRAVPLAVTFLVIGETPMFYAIEVKQYGVDLVVTMLLLLLPAYVQTGQLTKEKFISLASIGAIATWFSHPAIFVLATVGLYLAFFYSYQKQWKVVIHLTTVYSIWLASFLTMYFFVMGGGLRETMPTSQWFFHFWELENAFMPHEILTGWEWLSQHYFGLFKFPAGFFNLNKVAGLLFLVGCFYLLQLRAKRTLFLCTVPLILTLVVNYFSQYPFPINHLIASRVLLFLIPCLYLVIAEGTVQFLRNPYKIAGVSSHAIITTALIALLITNPTFQAIKRLQDRFIIQNMKPLFTFLQNHRLPEDKLYLYHWVEPAFRYYAPQYGFNYKDCHLIHSIPPDDFLKEIDYFRRNAVSTTIESTHCILGMAASFYVTKPDLDALKGQGRVWLVFAHVDAKIYLDYLDKMGERLDEFPTIGAGVYLYHF